MHRFSYCFLLQPHSKLFTKELVKFQKQDKIKNNLGDVIG